MRAFRKLLEKAPKKLPKSSKFKSKALQVKKETNFCQKGQNVTKYCALEKFPRKKCIKIFHERLSSFSRIQINIDLTFPQIKHKIDPWSEWTTRSENQIKFHSPILRNFLFNWNSRKITESFPRNSFDFKDINNNIQLCIQNNRFY